MRDGAGPRDALALIGVVARWWRVVTPLLALTLAVTFLVVTGIPVHYKSTAEVIIESPRSVPNQASGVPGVENPLAQFNPSLAIVGDIVAHVVDEDAARDALHGLGASRSYTVQSSDLWDAPVLHIETVSREPSEATHTAQLVADAVGRELITQQTAAGADPAAFLTVRTLVAPAQGQRLYGGRVRGGLACIGIGTGIAVSLAVFLDARRRTRLLSAGPQAPTPVEPPAMGDLEASVGARS